MTPDTGGVAGDDSCLGLYKHLSLTEHSSGVNLWICCRLILAVACCLLMVSSSLCCCLSDFAKCLIKTFRVVVKVGDKPDAEELQWGFGVVWGFVKRGWVKAFLILLSFQRGLHQPDSC